MSRSYFVAAAAVVAMGSCVAGLRAAHAFDTAATIRSVKADAHTLVVFAGGEERTVAVAADAKILNQDGKPLPKGLASPKLKSGVRVTLTVERSESGPVVQSIRLGAAAPETPSPAPAPGGNSHTMRAQGVFRSVDLDKRILTLELGGQVRTARISPDAKVLDEDGKELAEGLKSPALKEGAAIRVEALPSPNGPIVQQIRLGGGPPKAPVPGRPQNGIPHVDTSSFKPLTELGNAQYHGFPGGLYPNDKNERPAVHGAAGVALARKVTPLDASGKPSPDGKIVLLTVGMSNTSQASEAFIRLANADPEKNPRVVLVNGAQGGMTAFRIQNPDDQASGTQYWREVDNRLQSAGVTRAQVEAIWIKQADACPTEGFPAYAKKLQSELAKCVQLFPQRFPNAKLVYLSSRTFGGYAKTPLNPEPYAYESGFSVKWLIEQQLNGDAALSYDPARGPAKSPWLSWGPYLWANGEKSRADGFRYTAADFSPQDGTHESPSGQQKVGQLLLQFFKTDPTTKGWFRSGK